MNKQFFFERNLLALSASHPALCSRLSGAETTLNRYKFLESRSGEIIPAWVDAGGAAHPLHSLVDPFREGKRLVDSAGNAGFLILLGLGGGYAAAEALERENIEQVLVIDYDINGMAELLSSREYIGIFKDSRFHLLVDLPAPEIAQYILELYRPVLCGGIRVLPLRTRTAFDAARFNKAGAAVEAAIDMISGDYSVQAYFGTRWFSNIIRNLAEAEKPAPPVFPVRHVAITAAGPSLDMQLPIPEKKRKNIFLIATDTSLPVLLGAGIEPDAVVSIDCQHISYYHFMGGLPAGIPLFLDLASPPLVASRTAWPHFFSGGHPLTRYISRYWRSLPLIDTSGANVTYAALSLAEYLGAEEIELYGADFAYPQGQTYARGTYIYSHFNKQQNRLTSQEALFSSFLFRSPLSKRLGDGGSWYYETRSLSLYRNRLEEKIDSMDAEIRPVPGLGAPIRIRESPKKIKPRIIRFFSSGQTLMGAADFLREYREKILRLPPLRKNASAYLNDLNDEENMIFTTLLPEAAAIKRRVPELRTGELMEAVRSFCADEIDRVIKGQTRAKGPA
jgi:hypothetical protein